MDDNDNAALATKLAALDITIEGHRRPVLVGAILDAGLQALRPGAKNAKAVIAAILDAALHNTNAQHAAEVVSLRRRIEELEKRLANSTTVFTVADITRIRTYYEYGMTPTDLAALYRVEVDVILTALGRREMAKKTSRRKRRDLNI